MDAQLPVRLESFPEAGDWMDELTAPTEKNAYDCGMGGGMSNVLRKTLNAEFFVCGPAGWYLALPTLLVSVQNRTFPPLRRELILGNGMLSWDPALQWLSKMSQQCRSRWSRSHMICMITNGFVTMRSQNYFAAALRNLSVLL